MNKEKQQVFRTNIKLLFPFTGRSHFTLETAIEESKRLSEESGIYFTFIKEIPKSCSRPEHCWVITNTKDPRIIEGMKTNGNR